MQYIITRLIIKFANVMGLSDALHLVGNDFSNANSAFFIAIVVMVIPNGRCWIADTDLKLTIDSIAASEVASGQIACF